MSNLLSECPDCSGFGGRDLDKCLGRGIDGRSNPPEYAVAKFREQHGIKCDNQSYRSGSAGGSVRIGGNQAEKPWDVSQPSRGLGDWVAKILDALGVTKVVKAATGKKGCGCKGRQKKLNELVPFESKGN